VTGIPGPVSGLKLKFHKSHIRITWMEPFSLIASTTKDGQDIKYCVLVVRREDMKEYQHICDIVNKWFSIPRFYFPNISYIWVTSSNTVGRGPAAMLRFPGNSITKSLALQRFLLFLCLNISQHSTQECDDVDCLCSKINLAIPTI